MKDLEAERLNRGSVLRNMAKRVREVEDALPTSCVWECNELASIADDLEAVAEQ